MVRPITAIPLFLVSTSNAQVRVPIAVKRAHENGNFYKGTHLIGMAHL